MAKQSAPAPVPSSSSTASSLAVSATDSYWASLNDTLEPDDDDPGITPQAIHGVRRQTMRRKIL